MPRVQVALHSCQHVTLSGFSSYSHYNQFYLIYYNHYYLVLISISLMVSAVDNFLCAPLSSRYPLGEVPVQ